MYVNQSILLQLYLGYTSIQRLAFNCLVSIAIHSFILSFHLLEDVVFVCNHFILVKVEVHLEPIPGILHMRKEYRLDALQGNTHIHTHARTRAQGQFRNSVPLAQSYYFD